jgi:iron complex outermembrane receptor protein
MKPYKLIPIAIALSATYPQTHAGDVDFRVQQMAPVVVTAPQMSSPLTIVTDPKAPRQPVPAHDGADYLKTIPGFAIIRKGGADGDPVLRGMAGSRLNINADGQTMLGGCSGRMDPPTAYIFPAEYDRITVIKGPQTVLYGPGGSAGTVLFERTSFRNPPGMDFHGSLMGGSFGRNDAFADARYNTTGMYASIAATRSHSDDYLDGAGQAVHSAYTRWSSRAAFGLTPDADTLIELSLASSDGRAAYADRGMDGAQFTRQNAALKFEKRHLSPYMTKVEMQVYRNYVDHVMDNYSQRERQSRMAMAHNPDRTTEGVRAAFTWKLGDALQVITGADMQTNRHTSRMGMGANAQDASSYQQAPRYADANFRNMGLFGEFVLNLDEQRSTRLISGARGDFWHAEDTRTASGDSRRDTTLGSSFIRYEHDLARAPATLYAGLGKTKRFPDYWELISKESAGSASAFGLRPEQTTQFDIGALYKSNTLTLTASAFYNQIDDFILIQSGVVKGAKTVGISRNIDASTHGGELGASYALSTHWKLDGALNYVRGENHSDGTVLAQMPPLATSLGITYDDRTWSLSSTMRSVAAQNRFDLNKGNIAGQDMGSSAGFTIFSINAGWRPRKDVLISAGIDNLTNKLYAEHLSRGGVTLAGYDQTMRINEPGRVIWLKAQFDI